MKDYTESYQRWLQNDSLQPELQQELRGLTEEKAIEDRFYRHLEFGTGGLRGVIGAGTNRMNKYTVRRVTEGLARYLTTHVEGARDKGVVIAYDSRHMSPEFAAEAAGVLAQHGVRAYLFQELRPTPELSFAVRHLGAAGGIVVTASHNPPEYNGYKVYGEDGGQLPPHAADLILAEIVNVADELVLTALTLQEGIDRELITMLGEEIDALYNERLVALSLQPDVIKAVADDVRIVFTPLHGTGNKPVRRALATLGFRHVHVVPEQELPDPNFSTVKSPNPEERQAFTLALQLAEQVDADVVFGTDPDADRVGVVARDANGEFFVLNGNQTGALLLHYILEQRKANGTLPANGVMLKTIVTSNLGGVIAEANGIATVDVLTGFKFIGEKIKEYETTGEHTFLFGYEESYGYLIGDFVRDKDAVQAAMMAAEMAAFYKAQGKTLSQVLEEIYARYGTYLEDLLSFTFKGKEGQEKIAQMMEDLRRTPLTAIGDLAVEAAKDYAQGIEGLPKANVLKYVLADGSWVAIRPSGTEPKIKFYFSAVDTDRTAAQAKLDALKSFVMQLVS
ncbi:phospho-sugar mutase [Tumebacillus permanentifrigoris]|uniref:Phosphoglucomutase n=1 Tax=Tumebacillus permanentifrigoris TaxID=378543 RepID=A0A316E0A4_9BACL|nr:phospho-sugar mutase [Tumebacillus permanentifrigoris]PWK16230.1 alpha-phosphoglucomutase [Tumebacillus permanentifrigoris]